MKYRNTKQKSIILSAIEDYGHATIEDLKRILAEDGSEISLATLYRDLQVLQDEGKINKLYINDKAIYEIVKRNHYHFECTKCRQITDIDPDLIEIKLDSTLTGVSKQDIFLYGICEHCRKNNN